MRDSLEQLRELYEQSDRVRCSFRDVAQARPIYERYVEFVAHHAPARGKLLDAGCGTGWSTYFFAEAGFEATGVDLNPGAFEPPALPNLAFMNGSVVNLPFDDNSFAVVTAHQVLEHIPDPARMLSEMNRVLRPGGLLCIVGPNLLSLANCLRAGLHAWRNRPLRRILIRGPETPRHPFGNTFPEACASSLMTVVRVIRKKLQRQVSFTYREPDLRPPFHGDNDAVYLCNPLDVGRYLRTLGFTVLRDVALRRTKWTRMLAGGTWVAARKPTPAESGVMSANLPASSAAGITAS
jgi:SAM-dependent methyltransferase